MTTTLTTLSLLAAHDHVALWLSVISTLQAIAIFSLSIKYGMGGWAKSDIVCMGLAVIGIVVWQVTKNPVYGLYFGILADFMGMLPTILKTYRYPETEMWQFFGIDALAGTFNFLALSSFAPATFSYPLYLVFINGVIAILAIRKKTDRYLRYN